jgi:hypothetical protein
MCYGPQVRLTTSLLNFKHIWNFWLHFNNILQQLNLKHSDPNIYICGRTDMQKLIDYLGYLAENTYNQIIRWQ